MENMIIYCTEKLVCKSLKHKASMYWLKEKKIRLKTTVSMDGIKWTSKMTANRTSAVNLSGEIKRVQRPRKTLRPNGRCFVILKMTFHFSQFLFSTRSTCKDRRCPVFNYGIRLQPRYRNIFRTWIVHKSWLTVYVRGKVKVVSLNTGRGQQTFLWEPFPSFVIWKTTQFQLIEERTNRADFIC